jgi:hypothetical protein
MTTTFSCVDANRKKANIHTAQKENQQKFGSVKKKRELTKAQFFNRKK